MRISDWSSDVVLFRSTQKQLDSVGQDIAVLREAGIDYQLLARHELQQVEPALAHSQDKLAGGLRLPNDETGDCNIFNTRLATDTEKLGVQFRTGMNIQRLLPGADRKSTHIKSSKTSQTSIPNSPSKH